ncbi:hypothetical protein [Amycolatopsis anabasis]|uniref:hypothetical protein n=1 Tax=Amycolatopsis anabasis TaxID=1840409 RepID=UPI00131BD82D|nr:hypothetical protein [Amycolatopsis anabasis]
MLLAALIGALRKQRRQSARVTALTNLAGQLGGTVHTGPEAARPRAATLTARQPEVVAGRVWGMTRYESALDFQRGRWPVRVAEGSRRESRPSWNATDSPGMVDIRSHVVEIPTPSCPRLHFLPVRQNGLSLQISRQLDRPPIASPVPADVWASAPIPEAYRGVVQVSTSNAEFATAVLNDQLLQWIAAHAQWFTDPVQLEYGLLYTESNGAADPASLLPRVDFLVGLLERIPHHAWQYRH